MEKDEKILLVFAGAALVAVILWKATGNMRLPNALDLETGGMPIQAAGVSQDPTPQGAAVGPLYLTYNAPWAFAPPVGNIVPTATSGQIGEVENGYDNFVSYKGCCDG